jgi:chloramphenicol 3-O phosphotransferase
MKSTTPPISALGRVVLFNGAPSSGKSSLVKAVTEGLSTPSFHLSLDDFRAGIAERWWTTDEGQLFEQFVAGYLGSLRQMSLSGIDVMAEAVVTPARRRLYEKTFGDVPLLLIAVRCPLNVARRRERSRTDRRGGPITLSARYYADVYTGLSYDLEVASETAQPDELAAVVRAKIQHLVPTSFANHLIA